MKLRFLFFLFALSIIVSCKNESKSTPKAATIEPTTPKTPTTNAVATKGLKQEKPLTAHAIQFYTNLMWHYSAAVVINDPEKSKSYKGKWIKLMPDNTLETGVYDGTVSKGSWVVDEAKSIITILEEGERPTYSEWKIKNSSISDAVMIWVGTNRFGLNNTQIKMNRFVEKPVRAE